MKKIWIMIFVVCLLMGCTRGNTHVEEETSGIRDDVSAKVLVEAVASELGDEYWADMELAPEYLEDWYGISSDLYEEYYGQTPMISANVDALIVVKAAEDKKEKVEEALRAYRDKLVNDTMQYPSNIPKIQASMIETYGNYVCFVQLGGSMNNQEDEEEAMKVCMEANEQALSIIKKELTK
ncbi:MAG: DUF4358 domain-containing protein [Lachnospiraceae bacterium]|jgi:hypothetical protein|nr:DUF4358 domain-containing protein [Lachnospiraceae bacterium]MDE7058461.1 DUF4358 domain-containing protein [Lachnospiraceae bacterium]